MSNSEKTQLTSKASTVISRLRSALAQLLVEYEDVPDATDADGQALFQEARNAIAAADRYSGETGELQRALHVIDEAGKLSDWINRARPVVTDLMAAYERRIRTDCTPEQLAKEPWRCMEYIGAENLLRDQPIAVVELTAQKAGEQR